MAKKQSSPAYLTEPHWSPLAQFKADPENANTHDARSIESLARSFLRFGMRKNVVADKHKVIRAGNGAYEAIQWIHAQADAETGDVRPISEAALRWGILRIKETGLKGMLKVRQFVPYIRCEVTQLEGDEATAYALADNRTGQLSSLDMSKVAAQLGKLQERTAIDDLGWNDAEIGALLLPVEEKHPPDEFPSYGEDIETQYQCPFCKYQWSGKVS